MSITLELSGLSPLEIFGSFIVLLLLRIIYDNVFYFARFNPSKVPVVGAGIPGGILAQLRKLPKVYRRGQPAEWVEKGYLQYQNATKNPVTFLVPYQRGGYMYILPPNMIGELKAVSDEVLSFPKAMDDELSLSAIFGNGGQFNLNSHVSVVRRKLITSFQLEKFVGILQEEIESAFNELWDTKLRGDKHQEGNMTSRDWVDIAIKDIQDVIVRVNNRVFVGLPLCRDRDFCNNILEILRSVFDDNMAFFATPKWTHRILSPIITFKLQRRIQCVLNKLRPTLDARMALHEKKRNGNEKIEEPEDLIQYLIVSAENDAERYRPFHLNKEYLLLNLAATHSTSITFYKLLNNLASQTLSNGTYWDLLRAEMIAVDHSAGTDTGAWTKRKLDQLVGLDSFLRETARRDLVDQTGLVRKCIDKRGYVFSNGLRVRQGECVGIAAQAIHKYQGASGNEFNGFRYSRPYQELVEDGCDPREIVSGGSGKLSTVSTGEDYLVFGHGKHACPGRFYAVTHLKLLLKHVILNYEMGPPEKKPVFPTEAVIRLRKRILMKAVV